MLYPAFLVVVFLAFAGYISSIRRVFQRDEDHEVKKINRIGLGTAALGDANEEIVKHALSLGVKMIDTAQADEWYDEAAVGKAVKDYLSNHVDDLTIVTKIHPRFYGLEAMEQRLQESIDNFGEHTIDVILLHSPRCWEGHCTPEQEEINWQDGWRHLETLQKKIQQAPKKIGISNFQIDELKELVLNIASHKVSVIQNWMDPLQQDREVRAFCKEHDIEYMAYSSFGTQWGNANIVLKDPLLLSIARKYDTTVSQVILAWLDAEGVISIPRSRSLDHLSENFQVCSISEYCLDTKEQKDSYPGSFSLTEEDLKQIRSLDGTHGTPWD